MKKAFCFIVFWLIMIPVMFPQTVKTLKKPTSYPADLYIKFWEEDTNISVERGYRGDLPIYSTRRSLKGSVKSLKVKTFSGKMKFGEFQIQSAEQFSMFFFDEMGFLIERNDYASDSRFINKSTYKYDNNGNHKETLNFFSKTAKFDMYDHPVSRIINIYDENGNQIESNNYKLDGSLSSKSIFKLDEKNKLIEKNDYNSEGDLLSKSEYKYDAKGNLISRMISDIEIRSDVDLFANRNLCFYNGKGDLIKQQYQYWPHQEVFYKYDEMGNLIQEKSSSPDFVIIYKYEYDNKGNWIKKSIFKNGIQAEDYTEREIVYY